MTRAKHTTLYGRADKVIRKLEESDLVERIALGRSVGKSHGHPDGAVKLLSEVPAGFRLLIYSSRGLTEAVVFCAEPNKPGVRALIEAI